MSNMKYELNNELLNLSRAKVPLNVLLFPIVNAFLKLHKCVSDNRVNVKTVNIPTEDGLMLKSYLIEPRENTGTLPCIVFYHGGGYLLRASKSHYQIAKMYADYTPCKVIFADYRLMPKYRFPIAVNDCYDTYKWVIANAEALGIDKNKIIVTGDSAGANASAAVSMMLCDNEQTLPIGAMLIYPVLDRRMITDSMKKYIDTPVWDAVRNRMFWREYLRNKVTVPIKYASPMEAISLKGFPKTYIEVAEFDCLHDEGVLFAKRLQAENIPVEYYEMKGTCHGYDEAFESVLVNDAVKRRVKWIQSVFDP